VAEERSKNQDEERSAAVQRREAAGARSRARTQARRRSRSAESDDGARKEEADKKKAKEQSQVPATERPVPLKRKIAEYVVSVDEETGVIVTIEKLDPGTNTRTELTQEEYAAAYSYAFYAGPYYAGYAAALFDPLSTPAAQAYLKNIAKYAKTLTARP
jgi:hypothetical protein